MTLKRSDVPRRFFTEVEQKDIVAAIALAETRTSGEVRVYLERDVKGSGGDPYARAREIFAKLDMHQTAERNGVLVYLAVRSHRFAIVGDEELHRLVGEDFWVGIRDQMTSDFSQNNFPDGLIAGIAAIGEHLGRHFPHRDDDVNELPDDIAY